LIDGISKGEYGDKSHKKSHNPIGNRDHDDTVFVVFFEDFLKAEHPSGGEALHDSEDEHEVH
jgi:hypothetical protein